MVPISKSIVPSLGRVTLVIVAIAASISAGQEPDQLCIRIDQGHPWRPPYGLQRVERPSMVSVERRDMHTSIDNLWLSVWAPDGEIKRTKVEFVDDALQSRRILLGDEAEEVVLLRRMENPEDEIELARERIQRSELEVEAVVKPAAITNPVDLGYILPSSGTLLLRQGDAAIVKVAALSRSMQPRRVTVSAWYEATPQLKQSHRVRLESGERVELALNELIAPSAIDSTALHVTVSGTDGDMLWSKTIPTIIVQQPPEWPRFGATQTILHYDAPISVRDPVTGTFSTLPYDNAWKPELRDVVVSLPNGARFVFWRGASYIPFWAGKHNTGLCYEWAERLSPRPPNAVDAVEPLMDKELRYGRVKIMESTAARVHVRWTYQSTDLHYQVWGDSAVEDYYFYPDGFGTRVVDLIRDPDSEYELSEFIILTPAQTYPLAVLPTHAIDVLPLDGEKIEFTIPRQQKKVADKPHTLPVIYRTRLHKDASMAAVYFNPQDTNSPSPWFFAPFYDAGELVTPAYWGSHWPLARGNATGRRINDRVHITPCHNSLMTWGRNRPQPLSSGIIKTLDTLGRARTKLQERWAWLIGMTDASDTRLVAWAESYANPPNLQVEGASIEYNAYAMERRAIRLRVEEPRVLITLEPSVPCINPVFELFGAPRELRQVKLQDTVLAMDRFAWDGKTLWLRADIKEPAVLALEFYGHAGESSTTDDFNP